MADRGWSCDNTGLSTIRSRYARLASSTRCRSVKVVGTYLSLGRLRSLASGGLELIIVELIRTPLRL